MARLVVAEEMAPTMPTRRMSMNRSRLNAAPASAGRSKLLGDHRYQAIASAQPA
jgi:hypothetical protein